MAVVQRGLPVGGSGGGLTWTGLTGAVQPSSFTGTETQESKTYTCLQITPLPLCPPHSEHDLTDTHRHTQAHRHTQTHIDTHRHTPAQGLQVEK